MGSAISVVRLQEFGPRAESAVPMAILDAIEELPPGAKLAYACGPSEEVAFWEARLLGIDAHTGHRIVPLCFQADTSGILTDTPVSEDAPEPDVRLGASAHLLSGFAVRSPPRQRSSPSSRRTGSTTSMRMRCTRTRWCRTRSRSRRVAESGSFDSRRSGAHRSQWLRAPRLALGPPRPSAPARPIRGPRATARTMTSTGVISGTGSASAAAASGCAITAGIAIET